jgi:hypothetical protein
MTEKAVTNGTAGVNVSDDPSSCRSSFVARPQMRWPAKASHASLPSKNRAQERGRARGADRTVSPPWQVLREPLPNGPGLGVVDRVRCPTRLVGARPTAPIRPPLPTPARLPPRVRRPAPARVDPLARLLRLRASAAGESGSCTPRKRSVPRGRADGDPENTGQRNSANRARPMRPSWRLGRGLVDRYG